jgi:hypothetical protein
VFGFAGPSGEGEETETLLLYIDRILKARFPGTTSHVARDVTEALNQEKEIHTPQDLLAAVRQYGVSASSHIVDGR